MAASLDSGGLTNQPRVLRGAFVEFGISVPPLVVVFQFNPVTINRTRAVVPKPPDTKEGTQGVRNLDLVQQVRLNRDSLLDVRPPGTTIAISPETLTFDVRLDATDKLNDGDFITEQFGIAPQLATLELMMAPKSEGVIAGVASSLLSAAGGFTFSDPDQNPPVILFVWGRKKVLPVDIMSMQIKEEEFNADLNPTRATVTITLQVIEGPNAPFLYTKTLLEAMSLLNLANIGRIASTLVPL